ncbi:MAG: ATP phosphoribosyltransferase regulatory subunit, partial [Candidatus Syntropharchaeia archaeon]
MRDIPPEEMEKREWLLEKIKKVLKSYGFSLVEPSAIESIETLTAKCGEGVKEEIYWFKDKGGREVGLRFDLTVGLTRMAASMKGIPEPIRLACISNAWRYDEPQYGRYRCFWQWDAEIYGSEKIEADAEIILLTADVMDGVGMRDFIIRISDRKLMESFLRSIGVEKVLEVMRIIDKLKKIGKEGVRKELVKMKIKKVDDILEFAGTETKDITVLEKFCNEKSYMESLEKLRVLGELLEEAGEKRYV